MIASLKNFIRRIIFRLRGDHTTEDLIANGLRVGDNFVRMVGVILDPAHCHHILIGNDVTLAPRVHILAHDASLKMHLGYARIANVTIEDRVFVGADTVIMPGVTIGHDSIIGANSTVTKSIPSGVVAAGSPAKVIYSLDDFLARHRENMKQRPVYGEEYSLRSNPSMELRRKMYEDLSDGESGYIV